MADVYTDLQIVECNRLHSEEAKTNNNENFALWQNNLQDIVHLDAGDKVSVHGAMVSERGAGQSSSIEVKGESLGFTVDYNFTTIDEKNACDSIATLHEIIECNASSKTIEMRDDELNFTTNYYVNMNGHNYIHLPRRFWYEDNQTTGFQWGEPDSLAAGMTHQAAVHPNDNFYYFDDLYQILPTNADFTAQRKYYKPRNNNDRYTVMLRDKTYYTESSADGNLPAVNYRDPENAIYRTYTELKTLTLRSGFNSPEFVAKELSRQLQKITDTKTFEFRDEDDIIENVVGFPIRVYKTISTETYKPFNVAFAYLGDGGEGGTVFGDYGDDFNSYFTATGNASGYKWLSQYHCIATKRPELYETGRLCNRFDIAGANSYRGIFGCPMDVPWNTISNLIHIAQDYNASNCKLWKDFFDAQDLYPEIYDAFSDSRSSYDDGDNINNSRWIHMNRFKNASMSYTGSSVVNGDAMLGDSGYVQHSWNTADVHQVKSVLVPIYYDPSQRDTFYEKCPLESDHYTYGCMKCSADGRIYFTGTKFNGAVPESALYTYLKTNDGDAYVGQRKLGFDMHFSAPGMAYVLPYAGYSFEPNSYTTAVREATYGLGSGYYNTTGVPIGRYAIDSQLYRNKLYIGADNAKINWNGTNFSISDLHTALNKGNNDVANDPYVVNETALATIGDGEADTDASAQVYKINPTEQYNDFTPARKPYTFIRTGVGTTKPTGRDFNSNLEAWTIYDSLCGIFIKDINLTETQWQGTLWDILGFTYKQFNSTNNTRLTRIDNNNLNDLSLITTNAVVQQSDSKIYVQNFWKAQLFNNMMPNAGLVLEENNGAALFYNFPEIVKATSSVLIVADNLPTRMIRGYYTIRSNILQGSPFVGGKVNNTVMPIIGVVDKINGDGDFYFGQESSLEFTITKPLKLASLTTSIHDPDGSYARCSKQSTVLFKIKKTKRQTFDVVSEILEAEKEIKK